MLCASNQRAGYHTHRVALSGEKIKPSRPRYARGSAAGRQAVPFLPCQRLANGALGMRWQRMVYMAWWITPSAFTSAATAADGRRLRVGCRAQFSMRCASFWRSRLAEPSTSFR